MDEICTQNQPAYISEQSVENDQPACNVSASQDNQSSESFPQLQTQPPASDVIRLPFSQNLIGKSVLLTVLTLISFGVVAVTSALVSVKVDPNTPWYALASVKHMIFAAAAIVILAFTWRIDYRILAKGRIPYLALTLFLTSIALCLLVNIPYVQPVLGHQIGGKYRWLKFGAYQFQPSELLKISMIFFLGSWLTKLKDNNVRKFKTFLIASFCILFSALLVIQYDMSSAALIMLSGGIVMLIAGVRWQFIIGAGVLAGLAVGFYIYNDPMRMKRVEAMLDPFDSKNKSSYQIRQALVSIYSGDKTGVGLGKGVRKLGFVPEDSTDFIFASIAEEWGLIGAYMLIFVFMWFMWSCKIVAKLSPDKFGSVVAGTIGATIGLQVLMHICVNFAVLPPTGIGLPLISAGGTRLIMLALSISMVLSVSARRKSMDLVAKDDPELLESKRDSNLSSDEEQNSDTMHEPQANIQNESALRVSNLACEE